MWFLFRLVESYTIITIALFLFKPKYLGCSIFSKHELGIYNFDFLIIWLWSFESLSLYISNLIPGLSIFPSSFDAKYNKFKVFRFKSIFPKISDILLHLPKADTLISSSWHSSFVKVNEFNTKRKIRL